MTAHKHDSHAHPATADHPPGAAPPAPFPSSELPFDVPAIMKRIPHRYPFLLIDRIIELRERFIVGIKCVTANEPFFQGHFPGHPVMPGVLQVECIAQTAAVLAYEQRMVSPGKVLVLAGITDARFRRLVTPGDVLRIEVEEIFRRKNIGRATGKITVEDQVACEATITFGVTDV